MILNVSYGAVFGLGLLGIGYFLSPTGEFPSVALLATVAGLVRFVPYVGPLVGGAVPLFFSIAIFPGYTVFFGVLTLIAVMELVSNNVVEPWLYGTSTGVSVVAIILAAVFWGWMWGPVGVLLATPLTVCAVVLGQYVPKFRFFATLLSEDVAIKPYSRAYQRLLSGDPHKLAEVLDAEIKRTSHLESLDAVVVPLIKCILTDRDPHGLNDAELTDRLAVGMVEVGLLREQPMRESSEQVEAQEANGSVTEWKA